MILLGIETSCDETSAAVIETDDENKSITLLSNVIASSVSLHAKTGGIIPEIAAREQIKYIIPVINTALREADSILPIANNNPKNHTPYTISNTPPNIDAIAVTVGPGLIGSLLVGVETAKTLAYVWNKPIVPVNHLFGHIYANWIREKPQYNASHITLETAIEFPALTLIVSGGHTDLVLLKEHQKIQWLSGTRDDAAGEAFDKIGRLLGLPYPAGPSIEKLAAKGNPKAFHLPRPLLHEETLDFSFSGLKTAALREVQKIEKTPNTYPLSTLNTQLICDLSRATQDAIIDVLVKKTVQAAEKHTVQSILLSGGVAANKTLVEKMKRDAKRLTLNTSVFVPPKNFCTDNGAMIASAAFFNYKEVPWKEVTANPELYFD